MGVKGGAGSYADTHLLSDRGDTCSTSATWSYRQQDLEEKDDLINQSVNAQDGVCTELQFLESTVKYGCQ